MNYASMHIKHIRVGSWVGVKWEWHSEMGNNLCQHTLDTPGRDAGWQQGQAGEDGRQPGGADGN